MTPDPERLRTLTRRRRWRRQRVNVRQLTAHAWTTRVETWPEYFARLAGRPRHPAPADLSYDDLVDALTVRVRQELEHPTEDR